MRPQEIGRSNPVSPVTTRISSSSSSGERRISAVSGRACPSEGPLTTDRPRPASAARSTASSSAADPARAQRLGDAGNPQQPRDARDGLEVRSRGHGGRHDEEDEVDRDAVERRRSRRAARWRRRPRPRRPRASRRQCGMAMPPPTPVQPSRSRFERRPRSSVASRTAPCAASRFASSPSTSSREAPGRWKKTRRGSIDPSSRARGRVDAVRSSDQHSGTISPRSPSRRR